MKQYIKSDASSAKSSVNDGMLVSICVPVYGVEKYIERCAVSLFEQTYGNIEFVFVNDCTQDASIDILYSVISRYPEREKDIKIIVHNKNRGLAAARNTALSHSSGKYILWVDSDDYIEKDAVELLLDIQRKNCSDIVIFNAKLHSRYGYSTLCYPSNISKDELLYGIISRKYRPHIWFFLINKEIYNKYNIRVTEGIDNGEDYLTTPQLLYYAKIVTILNRELYNYDDTRQDSLSGTFSFKRDNQEWEATLLLEQFFSDKEEQYRKAVNIAKLSRVLNTIKNICNGYGNKQDFERYNAIKKMIPHQCYKGIPMKYIPLIIINDFRLACLYVKGAVYVKKIMTIFSKLR